MTRKLLVIDVETGGLNADLHSILSLGAVVVNDGAVEGIFYKLINESGIIAGPSALKVNGLTLDKLREEGISPTLAVMALENFLLEHDMRSRVTLVAHNAKFDVAFLERLYRLAGADFGKRFSYRSLCTQTAALLLEQAGRWELPGGSASLENVAKLCRVELHLEGGHNALDDALACAGVLRCMTNMLRSERV